MSFLRSTGSYLASHKRLWLLPMATVVVLFLLLVLLMRSSPESFVYTLF